MSPMQQYQPRLYLAPRTSNSAAPILEARRREARLDQALESSFPASDPVASNTFS